MNELSGKLAYKGERGYSAYEIAVQNGFIGTEQDWLATLGTASHFSKEIALYTTEESETEFNTPITVAESDSVEVYVNGLRLNEDEYTVSSTKVTTEGTILEGNTVEVVVTRMSTSELPIVTTINSSSTTSTVPSTKTVYDYVLEKTYPVGSIYMSVSDTSPATLFGGTWEQIKDTFLLSAGDTYTSGDTGGEATHTLTTTEMPSHNHGVYGYRNGSTTDTSSEDAKPLMCARGTGVGWSDCPTGSVLSNTGGGRAHNNMPPYLVVYMWKRTA